MTISYVATSAATNTTTSGPPAINAPAGVHDGDYLFAFALMVDSGSGTTITPPAGWTAVPGCPPETFGTSQVTACGVWYRVASSEPSSYTFTMSPSSQPDGIIIVAYRGVTGLDSTGTNVSTTSPVTSPATTTHDPTGWVLRLFAGAGTNPSLAQPAWGTVRAGQGGGSPAVGMWFLDSNGTVPVGVDAAVSASDLGGGGVGYGISIHAPSLYVPAVML